MYGTGPTTAAKGWPQGGHSRPRGSAHCASRGVGVHGQPSLAREQDLRRGGSRPPGRRRAERTARHGAAARARGRRMVGRGTAGRRGQMIHHAIGLDREQFTEVTTLPQGKLLVSCRRAPRTGRSCWRPCSERMSTRGSRTSSRCALDSARADCVRRKPG
ncbi:hypothetical protein QJS66_00490 [Kocuria rhizophila]|nr:hypothetical protein QJS66_00490 [Kocuria rhizophila]